VVDAAEADMEDGQRMTIDLATAPSTRTDHSKPTAGSDDAPGAHAAGADALSRAATTARCFRAETIGCRDQRQEPHRRQDHRGPAPITRREFR
jgi:hypothetical protein